MPERRGAARLGPAALAAALRSGLGLDVGHGGSNDLPVSCLGLRRSGQAGDGRSVSQWLGNDLPGPRWKLNRPRSERRNFAGIDGYNFLRLNLSREDG